MVDKEGFVSVPGLGKMRFEQLESQVLSKLENLLERAKNKQFSTVSPRHINLLASMWKALRREYKNLQEGLGNEPLLRRLLKEALQDFQDAPEQKIRAVIEAGLGTAVNYIGRRLCEGKELDTERRTRIYDALTDAIYGSWPMSKQVEMIFKKVWPIYQETLQTGEEPPNNVK